MRYTMKFIVAFVHRQDAKAAADALRDEGFRFTALDSKGGFLQQDSSTFLLGVRGGRLEECLDVLRMNCQSRTVGAPGSLIEGKRVTGDEHIDKGQPTAVEVGGVVAFVFDAEKVL